MGLYTDSGFYSLEYQRSNLCMSFRKIKYKILRKYERNVRKIFTLIKLEAHPRHYSQIHPTLQQIPAHSTLELCLWWLALDRDITAHIGAS